MQANTESDRCEILFALPSGALGPLTVARHRDSAFGGALLVLRQLGATLDGTTVAAARRLNHPQLNPVLGFANVGNQLHVASPLVAAATALELERAAQSGPGRLDKAVAARIVHDALLLCAEAQRQLASDAPIAAGCDLFPDTLWLTATGTIHLSECGIARQIPALEPARQGSKPGVDEASSPAPASSNIVAAARLLSRLGHCSVEPFVTIVARALSGGPTAFANEEQMAKALAAQGLASDRQLAGAVRELCQPILVEREALLRNEHVVSASRCLDDPTSLFDATDGAPRGEGPNATWPGSPPTGDDWNETTHLFSTEQIEPTNTATPPRDTSNQAVAHPMWLVSSGVSSLTARLLSYFR
jgi:hypothetical protein